MVEADEIRMMERFHLNDLELGWSGISERDMEILEALKPHSHLQNLKILCYSQRSPSWIVKTHLPHLKKLELWRCQGLESVPTLENLTSLNLIRCLDLRSLPSWVHLAKLEVLEIDDCPKLTMEEQLFTVNSNSASSSSLTILVVSLKELSVDNWELLASILKSNLPFLVKLFIEKCENLTSFTPEEEIRWGSLTLLKSLQ